MPTSRLIPLFIWISFVLSIFGKAEALSREPIVTISPAQITLHPAADENQSSWRELGLSITNRTAQEWQFSNFYESFSPVLMSEDGVFAKFASARDATIRPRLQDFPFVRPGRSARAKTGCRVLRAGTELIFVLPDRTGGIFSTHLNPGHYKLSLSYRAQMRDGFLTFSYAKPLGLSADTLWLGWQMSNWIDIIVAQE